MHAKPRSMTKKMLALFGVGLLVCAGTASAQMFEGNYGAPSCREGGRSVVPISTGGYISVGQRACEDCLNNDIYVVQTRDDGALVWSAIYDLGDNDVATSVKEVFNDPDGNGGFIITGFTQDVSCTETLDAFLLRLGRCGEIIWVKTYGDGSSAEAGHEVVEATTGDGSTNRGDFVVAGWTTYNSTADGGQIRDGYIFRTDAGGNLIWDQVYDLGQDDYFYSIDEALLNSPEAGADIVAAGGTTSSACGSAQNTNAWIVRVNGNDGVLYGAPHNSTVYGSSDFEEFRSIRELRNTNYGYEGSLVATGTARSASGSRDVYVVQTTADPGFTVADRVFGDLANYPEEGLAIRETTIGSVNYSPGYIVVTGYMRPDPNIGGLGGDDAFVQVLEPGSLNVISAVPGPALKAMLFGGPGNDRGLSLESIEDWGSCRTLGYIVTGFTQSISGDPQQLYLFKTDEQPRTDCSKEYDIQSLRPYWQSIDQQPDLTQIMAECDPQIDFECLDWYDVQCYNPLGTNAEECQAQQTQRLEELGLEPCSGCPQNGAKRLTGTSESGTSGVVALSSFPNPVKSGSAITLEYTLLKDAPVSITISDLTGRTVYTGTAGSTSGVGTASIGTEGWASGSYIVSVSADGKSTTTRIVVTD